jgi:hypothetical protein
VVLPASDELIQEAGVCGAQFTCFTGIKSQVLTYKTVRLTGTDASKDSTKNKDKKIDNIAILAAVYLYNI